MIRVIWSWLWAIGFALRGHRIAPRQPLTVQGERRDDDGIPVLTLRGSPYERGHQHGSLCRADLARFRRVAWAYAPRTATERFGIPFWLARVLIKPVLYVLSARYLPTLPLDVRTEMQALADGSGINIRDVALVTVIWEVFAMVPSAGAAAQPTHCSEVAFDPAVSSGGVFGYNYDMLVPADRVLVDGFLALFVVEPTPGARYLAPNTIGSIGLNTAMNEHGLTFGWDNSYLHPVTPKGTNRTPYMLLLREIAVQCTTIAEATARLRQEERREADISVLADAQGVAVVELAGHESAFRTATAVWSCNRLQALANRDYLGAGRDHDGRPERYPVLVHAALAAPPVTPTDVAAILRDIDPDGGRSIASFRTAFTAIYALGQRRIWLSFAGAPASRQHLYAFTWSGHRDPDADIPASS